MAELCVISATVAFSKLHTNQDTMRLQKSKLQPDMTLAPCCAVLCCGVLQAKAAAEARQLAPTPRQAQTAAAKAVAAQQRPTVVTRLPEQFNRQVRHQICTAGVMCLLAMLADSLLYCHASVLC